MFHDKVAQLRREMKKALGQHFERELVESVGRIEEAIAPYTRYISSQDDATRKLHEDLQEHAQQAAGCLQRIELAFQSQSDPSTQN